MADVQYMFERKGLVKIALSEGQDTDELISIALEGGALDVVESGEREVEVCVTCITSVSLNAHRRHVCRS